MEMVQRAVQNRVFNLSHEVVAGGKCVSKGYLASRLHAGYGTNYEATQLVIPPPILYVLWSNFEYVEYLKAYSRTLKTQYVDKGRVFKGIFIKWIQARCRARADTFKHVMADFCPDESILADIPCSLDVKKVKGEHDSAECANEISEYLNTHETHIYIPAHKFQSSFIFLVPPMQRGSKILIGVRAKCGVPDYRIQRHEVEAAVAEFRVILEKVRINTECNNTKESS